MFIMWCFSLFWNKEVKTTVTFFKWHENKSSVKKKITWLGFVLFFLIFSSYWVLKILYSQDIILRLRLCLTLCQLLAVIPLFFSNLRRNIWYTTLLNLFENSSFMKKYCCFFPHWPTCYSKLVLYINISTRAPINCFDKWFFKQLCNSFPLMNLGEKDREVDYS